MKTTNILAITFALTVTAFQAIAQTTPNLAVSDEELMKYATAMDSVNEMSATVRLELADMVKEGHVMDAARYNDLNKIINDEQALQQANATPQEIQFVKDVVARKEEEMTRINSTYKTLATDYVTPAVFNKVKKAIATDPTLKKRYDSLMIELGKDDPSADQH